MDHQPQHHEGHHVVTIPPQFSRERLADAAAQNHKIGPEFAAMRGSHLADLSPVEAVVREAAPLPISYDVNRLQQPYFSEFTYTEMIGAGLLVSPMSVEVSARLVQAALDRPEQGFDAAASVLDRVEAGGSLDKYKLSADEAPKAKAVAFLPGSNIFHDMVSREALSRAMHEDDDLVIKPHPMTDGKIIGELCGMFGCHRVLEPRISGHACLMAAERVYALSTTEMGLYAVLMGKPVTNIGNFWNEGRGAYSAFYRPLWGKSPADAKAILTKALNSPFSGLMHKDDPDLSERASTFFQAAMDIRALMKPLMVFTPPAPPAK